MSIRKLVIWESCIYYLIFTKGTQLFLEDNFFQTAKFLQKHYPSFQRTNLNQLCKRVNLTINRRWISLKRLKYEYSSGKCESSWNSGLVLKNFYQLVLSALKEAFDSKSVRYIPTENLIKIEDFILRNKYFEINNTFFW